MLNDTAIMGRLTADPELRRTSTGTPVCSFTLAVERDGKPGEDGKRATDFIDCVAWRGTAEFLRSAILLAMEWTTASVLANIAVLHGEDE